MFPPKLIQAFPEKSFRKENGQNVEKVIFLTKSKLIQAQNGPFLLRNGGKSNRILALSESSWTEITVLLTRETKNA